MARGPNKKTHLDLFGEVEHVAGDLWKRAYNLYIFGREQKIFLYVDVDPKTGIEQKQLKAVQYFLASKKTIVEQAETAVLSYYFDLSTSDWFSESRKLNKKRNLSIVKSLTDLHSFVDVEGITFPYARHESTFGILCGCSWDPDQGNRVQSYPSS